MPSTFTIKQDGKIRDEATMTVFVSNGTFGTASISDIYIEINTDLGNSYNVSISNVPNGFGSGVDMLLYDSESPTEAILHCQLNGDQERRVNVFEDCSKNMVGTYPGNYTVELTSNSFCYRFENIYVGWEFI